MNKPFPKFIGNLFLISLLYLVFPLELNAQTEEDTTLTEILLIMETEGELGLREYAKENKEKLSRELIVKIADAGYYQSEERLLKIALILSDEYKDKKTEADVNFYYANYKFDAGDSSTDYLNKAQIIYAELNDLLGQGNVYFSKGQMYFKINEIPKALDMYSKALTYYEKANSWLGKGNVYQRHGDVYLRMGENQKAVEMYSKAITFFEPLNDSLKLRTIYVILGDIYYLSLENKKALEMYSKVLPYFEKDGDWFIVGNIYLHKGELYERFGNNQKALEEYSNAFPYFEKANKPSGQGNVYYSKGKVYFTTGDNTRALDMFSKAFPYFEKANEPSGQGNVYIIQGDVYLSTGDNKRALEMYSKALPFFEKANDSPGEGEVYLGQGIVYFTTGDNTRALEMFSKAWQYFEKTNNPLGQGNVCLKKGDVCLATEDLNGALEMYSKALPYFEKINDQLGQGNVYSGQAEVYYYTGDNQKALEMYSKALPFYQQVEASSSIGRLYLAEAEAYDNEELISEAKNKYIDGMSLIERSRTKIGFPEMKISFMEKKTYYYDKAIRFMIENQYNDVAFEFTEALKARTFLDQLVEKNIGKVDKGLSDELKQERDELTGKISYLRSELQNNKDEVNRQKIKDEIKQADSELDNVIQRIRFENPLYASVNYYSPIPIDSLQKYILKPTEILIEYFVSEEDAYTFLITRDSFEIIKLPVTSEELINSCITYLVNCLTDTSCKMNSPQDYLELNEFLIKLIIPLIKDKTDLIIVPDGQLSRIPFEAIITSFENYKPRYLIEDFTIKYIQSATLLAFQRTQYKNENISSRFIGFGDPVYDYENFSTGKQERGIVPIETSDNPIAEIKKENYTRDGGEYDRLEGTGEEIRGIAKIFSDQQLDTTIYLRNKATEEMVKNTNMKQYGYISFACHGSPQCLVLSQIPNSGEDGFLSIDEIMNLDWNANLVVLSACQTGKGKIIKGEGVVGLTRAVMYAGCPAAVVSLWSVDDKSTKELMIKFYYNLIEKNMNKEEALRNAKLEMINTKEYSKPYQWAAFVMYGE